MITRPDYPSYGNWIARGATTLWELFQPEGSDRIGSLNHHFWGDISSWFTQALSGIRMAWRRTVNRMRWISARRSSRASHMPKRSTLHPQTASLPHGRGMRTTSLCSRSNCQCTMHGVIRLESGYVFEDGLAYKAAESGTYRIHSIE